MTSQTLDETYHARKLAVKFLNDRGFPVTSATLATMATRGRGPPFFKFGRYALYSEADLLRWAAERLGASAATATERRHALEAEATPK